MLVLSNIYNVSFDVQYDSCYFYLLNKFWDLQSQMLLTFSCVFHDLILNTCVL